MTQRRRLRRACLAGLLLPLLPVLYLLAWPTPFDPAPFDPPPAPALVENQRLAQLEWLGRGQAHGPEDVALDAQGRAYVGLHDGRILRFAADGSGGETVVDTGGRPLGLDFDAAGALIVADAWKGLLKVTPDGVLSVLSQEAAGVPFRFTDDVDVAPDGTIYFTDASSKYHQPDYRLDLLEHRPHGRLLAYDPATGETRVVLGDLYFANGVAVEPEGRFLLVVETGSYCVRRVWLRGERAGEQEVVCENLPGIPDGISTGTGGVFWVALASPRKPVVDDLLAPRPWLRSVVARLPVALQPAPTLHAFVLGIDAEGRVLHDLQDPSPDCFAPVTSVEEYGGHLYLGSLSAEGFARVERPR